MRLSRLLSVVVLLLSIAAPQAPASAAGEGVPSIDALMERLGYTADDKTALLSGKIISTGLERSRDDQLIAAVAMTLEVPLETLAENARKGRNIERDAAVTAFGTLTASGGAEQFAEAAYSAADKAEVQRLLKVAPDDSFNLSSEEIASLKAALAEVAANDPGAIEAASRAYQTVLAGRLQAYAAKGLDGIAPYDRGGKTLEPAEELRDVYDQAEPFLSEFFPDFGRALGDFPAAQSPDITSEFYWIKRDVEGRPTFILAHQMVQAGEGFALLSQRQYFVGHTYQSLQALALALPVEGGSAVFYVNSAFTDQITGFFNGVAQSVGQKRSIDDLEKYFKAVREGNAQQNTAP